MSNRRRLPSEKARRPRCIRCKGREFVHKVWENGDRTPVCESCGYVGATEHARDLPPAETRAESDPHATNGRVSTAQIADGDSA